MKPKPKTTVACPDRPLVLFDGECAFCRACVEKMQNWTAGPIDFEPFQCAADRVPEITEADLQQAVHLVTREGAIYRGAYAILLALNQGKGGRGRRGLLGCYHRIPGCGRAAEWLYGAIAANRGLLSRILRRMTGTGACGCRMADPPP